MVKPELVVQNEYRLGPRCIVYASGSPAPIFSYLRTTALVDSPILPTDLDVSLFFPNGCVSTRIDTVPNGFPLANGYRLFMSSGTAFAPLNKCIKRKFKCSWYGNLILAKYDHKADRGLGKFQGSDTDTLDMFVGM